MADRQGLGPVGEAVRENVRRLRERANLSYAEMARRLEDTGRPIPSLGLRRLEAGERKVDADDLVALAEVLNVSPVTLLMPSVAAASDQVQLLPSGDRYGAHRAWDWLSGYRRPDGASAEDVFDFQRRSAPTWVRPTFREPFVARGDEFFIESD